MFKFILCLTILSCAFALSEEDPYLFSNSNNWGQYDYSGDGVARCKPKFSINHSDKETILLWSDFQGQDCPYLNINDKTTVSFAFKKSSSYYDLHSKKYIVRYGQGKNEWYQLEFSTFFGSLVTGENTVQVSLHVSLRGPSDDIRCPDRRWAVVNIALEDKQYPKNVQKASVVTQISNLFKGFTGFLSGSR